MWKGIAFLDNKQDEMKLRRNYRQAVYSEIEVVPFKDQYFLRDYVKQIINQLDLNPAWVFRNIDKRNDERIKILEDKIHNFKGKKSELRTLLSELRRIEGYNPMRDTKEGKVC